MVSMNGWACWLSSQEPGLQGVLPYHKLALGNLKVNTEVSSWSYSSWRYKVKLYKKLSQVEHARHVRTGPLGCILLGEDPSLEMRVSNDYSQTLGSSSSSQWEGESRDFIYTGRGKHLWDICGPCCGTSPPDMHPASRTEILPHQPSCLHHPLLHQPGFEGVHRGLFCQHENDPNQHELK